MANLQLDSRGLLTEALEYACPHDASKLEAVKALHAAWTGESPQGAIYSGYRRQILSREGLGPSKLLAKQLREKFDTMLVLGIGGSALGTKTALSALRWTVSENERRRVIVVDNLDPIDFEHVWASLNLARTCFVVISKSGGTIETMAQASVVLERLEAHKLSIADHLVAITDPKSGSLRAWVENAGLLNLEVPPDVGGRFSVLTPVGLLPIAFAGIDIEALVEGAVKQFQGLEVSLEKVLQTGLRLSELERAGFIGHTLMPYSTLHREFGLWFVQLWGESLGKILPTGGHVGALPLAAVGATDQHSLLQLLVEGPNKVVTGFVRIENWPQMGSKSPIDGTLAQRIRLAELFTRKIFCRNFKC